MDGTTRFAILVSGRGSNMENIVRTALADPAFPGVIACVASDNPDAAGLAIARGLGVEAFHHPPGPRWRTRMEENSERDLARRLVDAGIDYVLLAGFMRMIKEPLLEAFPGRIVNIHPSLLPAFPGLDTHRRALEAGAAEHGCTVHFVDAGMDTGRIIGQAVVPVLPGDDEDSLASRVLAREHALYPRVVRLLAAGEIDPRTWVPFRM